MFPLEHTVANHHRHYQTLIAPPHQQRPESRIRNVSPQPGPVGACHRIHLILHVTPDSDTATANERCEITDCLAKAGGGTRSLVQSRNRVELGCLYLKLFSLLIAIYFE